MTKSLKSKIFDNWIAAILILPVNVLIIIPAVLLYLTNFTFNRPSILQIIFSLITGIIGLFFAGWSMLTFKSCFIFIMWKNRNLGNGSENLMKNILTMSPAGFQVSKNLENFNL